MNNEQSEQKIGILYFTITFFIVFFVLHVLGYYGPKFMDNSKCFQYLGCNMGFFGYDALTHFISSVMISSFVVWLMKKKIQINILHDSFFRNLVVIITIMMFITFSWEFAEYSRDQFRIKVLHENITHPNCRDQASDSDTMGDMTFSILGATFTSIAFKSNLKRKQ